MQVKLSAGQQVMRVSNRRHACRSVMMHPGGIGVGSAVPGVPVAVVQVVMTPLLCTAPTQNERASGKALMQIAQSGGTHKMWQSQAIYSVIAMTYPNRAVQHMHTMVQGSMLIISSFSRHMLPHSHRMMHDASNKYWQASSLEVVVRVTASK